MSHSYLPQTCTATTPQRNTNPSATTNKSTWSHNTPNPTPTSTPKLRRLTQPGASGLLSPTLLVVVPPQLVLLLQGASAVADTGAALAAAFPETAGQVAPEFAEPAAATPFTTPTKTPQDSAVTPSSGGGRGSR